MVSAGSYVGNSNGVATGNGNIGFEQEFSVASTGAVVTISSATPVTVVSSGATVTAGVYMASGVSCYSSAAATSFTVFEQSIGTTTNVLNPRLGSYSSETFAAMVPGTITLGTTTNELCKVIPPTLIKLTTTGTVFIVARLVFSVSGTISGYGELTLLRIQ